MPDDITKVVSDDFVTLVPLQGGPGIASPLPRRRSRGWIRLLLTVVLPTALAAIYLFGLAAPRYVSEARFSINRANQIGRLPNSGLPIEQGPKGLGEEDAYAVRDFLQSRDAMRLAIEHAGLRNMLSSASFDPLWAFPGLLNGQSDEDLFRYLQRIVSIDYNASSGITTLRVQGFTPESAQRLATVLLEGSEVLINRLNERARGDAVRVAMAEVSRARDEALAAADALTAFRNRWAVIDPTAMSQTVIAAITTLTLQSVETSAQLDVLLNSQTQSPQIAPLKARLAALQRQIEAERRRLGGSDASGAARVADYERLLLLRDFAARSFISALSVLEMVRLDLDRQQAYVSRIVSPQLADRPDAPWPVMWTAIVFAAGVAIFLLFRPASGH